MKKLTLAILVLFISSVAFSQKVKHENVPASVKATFQNKYPNVKNVKWDKENTNYEANFTVNKVDNSVLINEKGELLETETDIAITELPTTIIKYIETNYKGKKIKEAAKIMNAQGMLIYEAEVEGKDLQFDSVGKYLKTVKD